MGRLPPGYSSTPTKELVPMLLPRPDHTLVGRDEHVGSICAALQQGRSVLVHGGPGEGKTSVARAAGVSAWDKGTFPAGAYEVDLTGGGCVAHLLCLGRGRLHINGIDLMLHGNNDCSPPAAYP